MDQLIELYSLILTRYITHHTIIKRDNSRLFSLNKERFNIRAIFAAIILYLTNVQPVNRKNITANTCSWLKEQFGAQNFFLSIIFESGNGLLQLFDDLFIKKIEVDFNSIDVAELYELLLSIETGKKSKDIVINKAKNYKNKIGSYYTPKNLAKVITKRTIDTFFNLNLQITKISESNCKMLTENKKKQLLSYIRKISFADFSSGPGNFLIEILAYFDNLLTNLMIDDSKKRFFLKEIAFNIHAFDVDCIALEIAKIDVLLKIKQPNLYVALSKNFIHCNFLLQTSCPAEESLKKQIFSKGYLYHEKLAVNKELLKEYDIILGNPPWEKIRFEEKNFYALYYPEILRNYNKSSRSAEIKNTLSNNKQLNDFAKSYMLEVNKAKKTLNQNRFFTLSNKGELNTYALFTEAAINLKSYRGVIGLILKSAVVTSPINQSLFKHMTKNNLIIEIYDFINKKKIFNIDSRERFCFLLLGNPGKLSFNVSMNLYDVEGIERNQQQMELSTQDLKLINPFTEMLPNFSDAKEVKLLLRVHRELPVFKNVYKNVKFGRLVHFTNHSDYISKNKTAHNIAIYEGKFFNQFDGKFSGFNDIEKNQRYSNKAKSKPLDDSKKHLKDYLPEARFYIDIRKWKQLSKNYKAEFMLAWRSLTSATNMRTCIATILPFIPASQSVQFLTTCENDLPYLAGLFNSITFDFILKKKLSGIDLTQTVINQMPVPDIEILNQKIKFFNSYSPIKAHITKLVYSLLKNDHRLTPFFKKNEFTSNGLTEENICEVRRKLDLLFAYLYNINVDELKLIFLSFDKVYSQNDLAWFIKNLNILKRDNAETSSENKRTLLPCEIPKRIAV